MYWKITNQNVLFPLLLHYANSYIKGWMDRADIEGTHWWRVCVAAGWISHPCLYSFAISTDAKRIEAESPCFLETWQSITLFSALVVFDDLLSPPKLLVRGKREGGGVMDILVWCGHWDEKNSRGASSSSVSLCQICTLLLLFDQQQTREVARAWNLSLESMVTGPSALCKQAASTFVVFFTAVIYDVAVTPHI